MTKNSTTALVIARQGPLRESLVALLRALPEIDIIHYLDNPDLVLAFGADMPPVVVLVDGDLIEGDRYAVVKRAKNRWPGAGFIFFGNDVGQQREAQNAGMGLVLLKGHPAPQVVTLIRKLTSIGQEELSRYGGLSAT